MFKSSLMLCAKLKEFGVFSDIDADISCNNCGDSSYTIYDMQNGECPRCTRSWCNSCGYGRYNDELVNGVCKDCRDLI